MADQVSQQHGHVNLTGNTGWVQSSFDNIYLTKSAYEDSSVPFTM